MKAPFLNEIDFKDFTIQNLRDALPDGVNLFVNYININPNKRFTLGDGMADYSTYNCEESIYLMLQSYEFQENNPKLGKRLSLNLVIPKGNIDTAKAIINNYLTNL